MTTPEPDHRSPGEWESSLDGLDGAKIAALVAAAEAVLAAPT